jgi:AmmeMemoRadiSam system protein B
MQQIRPAACAGSFYPSNRRELESAIDALTTEAHGDPLAMIVPHAGYIYSGTVAGAAYSKLKGREFDKVVLLGPAHCLWFRGIALPGATQFETPLGRVPLDPVCNELARQEGFIESREAHRLEHALEVQLPFLLHALGNFNLIPLLVGDADPAAVSEVIDMFLGEPGTLVLASSDLSHFHEYIEAVRIDRITADAIMALDPAIDHEQACGATPVNGLLISAKRMGLSPRIVDMKNSGDTAGDKRRVVGYASFTFGEAA